MTQFGITDPTYIPKAPVFPWNETRKSSFLQMGPLKEQYVKHLDGNMQIFTQIINRMGKNSSFDIMMPCASLVNTNTPLVPEPPV